MKPLFFSLRRRFWLLLLLAGIPLGAYSRGGHGCHGHSHSHGHHSYGHSHSSGRIHYNYFRHSSFRDSGFRQRSMGIGTQQSMAHVVSIGAAVGTSDMVVVPDANMTWFTSNYMLNFRYQFNSWLALDLSAGTGTVGGRDTCNCNGMQQHIYNYNTKVYKFTAGLSVMYYSGALMQYYGGIQAGVSWFTEQDHYLDGKTDTWGGTKLTGQITILGVRIGHKLGVFGELGIGCKGTFNVGISYQPNWSAY